MISKNLKSLSILIISLTFGLHAQSMLGSQYPMGLPTLPSTGPSLSLEGTGTGIQNNFLGMSKNPANLASINMAVFNAAVSLEFLNLHHENRAANLFGFEPQILSLAIPFGNFGALGLSFDQRNNSDFKTHSNSAVQYSNLFSQFPDTSHLWMVQDGGSKVWQAGWGYSILNKVQLGLTYERYYHTNHTNFIREITGSVNDTVIDSSSITYRGNAIRGGVMVPLGKLTLGMTGEYIFADKSTNLDKVVGTDATYKEIYFKPPPSLGFGASYQYSPEVLVAADVGATLWKEFYSDLERPELRNYAMNYSLGGQYIPAPNLLTPRYIETVQYRGGFRYTQLPAAKASEVAFSLGAGLPIEQGGGLIDLILEYGHRWDSNFTKYNEDFFGIKFGINGGRKWLKSSDTSY